MQNIVNEDDFKYYMQDIERYYFGARYNYNELLNNEMVPFKFKTIITKYIKDEVDLDTSLESHLYYIEKDSFDYKLYRQLRLRIRTSQYKDPLNHEKGFKEKVYTIEQLVKMNKDEKEEKGIIIRELIISKLALLGFSI
ncbi:hypothetical protein SAMN04487928_102199 [Butyrivibrio proteoclasticus]|uniref:Uncharacterized protein n=1 Tax=Butyrivibrio proteoclasticus TaxID=43305 RepID=A0A1I5QMN2_9FIRM|nr:hypothetical protein [Butyrivibrio proteoclasticus]SFP47340.1 hypothetical protein SAMN04487928_102199 [Butyrivibrio proteoclasticus]